MNDRLKVSVADLFPGSYLSPGTKLHFPRIGWEEYEQTFAMIENNPEVYAENWPIYVPWHDWCLQRFGKHPCSGDPTYHGAAWAWPCVADSFRRMAASFQKHGYRPELATGGEADIEVAINGDGKIVVMQGNKRVALLRRMYSDFEVDVAVRHRDTEWLVLVESLTRENGGEKLYQPLPHPEFDGWPVTQPCRERLNMILGQLTEPRSLLDVGCNTGWFCREFADRNWACAGIDTNPLLIGIANFMQTWQYRQPPQAIFEHSEIAEVVEDCPQLEVCLFMSIVMHLFRQHGTDATWDILNKVSRRCGMMFLDCVWGGYSDALPFTPETIASEIIAHTYYTKADLLGYTDHEHRPFYWFRR